ncbi:hypothetical protein CLHUN_42560 [Ruminiclostridium hungatei]|uniref:Uncharacterized protein n=1 Tax=Ruminiclostridium hungatei TaxID=48256 RepID=A0A1V4SD81_RUMHU|nr:hypothetical protein [Ruminiclostridium hungatei]OPX41872.1 hypothetical protein CLHUN_42560 [Ruminiclostridium hungatei]
MMVNEIIHKNYICRLVLDLSNSMMAPLRVEETLSQWVSNPKINYKYKLSTYEIINDDFTYKYIIPDFTEKDAKNMMLLLSDIIIEGDDLPDAGIAFIDTESGELVPTNWDLGETEEWGEIIEKLNSEGRSLHTFSATDAVIELKKGVDTIRFQSLNWEDGLEESRNDSTTHVFIGKETFIEGVLKCMKWYKVLLNLIKQVDGNELQKELLQVLSVEKRRL